MGENIAGTQQVKNFDHQRDVLDPADMHHHAAAGAGHLASLDGALERLGAVVRDYILRHAHLDADRDIGVFRHRLGAGLHLGVVEIVKLRQRKRRQPDIGDVHEGIEPGAGLRHDEAAKAGEIAGAGIARRHAGGGALERHQLVGRDPDGGAIGVDMGMQVDEPGRHQPAAGVQHPQGPRGRDIGLDGLDHAVADADIAPAAQSLARIEHIAALDDEIELIVRPHGGECRRRGAGQGEGGGALQDVASGWQRHGSSSHRDAIDLGS